MTTVLVANRGEIARRIFRTAGRMGFGRVAVYSPEDADARFVREADEAIAIARRDRDPYLDIDAIVAAAKQSGADMVHPGYGFLAEDADFAEACQAAGLIFVGPTPEALRRLGSKDQARKIAEAVGAPLAPGYVGEQSDQALTDAAEEIGYPVLVKPVAGGGGKGMSIARSSTEMADALAAARRIAARAFGDDRLMLERFLEGSRHIEVQIFGDSSGEVVHLFERDCSVQRRYQKIIEEAPAPASPPGIEDLWTSAVDIGREVGYVNAGTCEFVVSAGGEASFLEVNARLQVEHPVTEAVCGIDLVEWQFRVAMGEPIPLSQDEIVREGHAIEARIYAEDPDADFLPSAGTIHLLRWGTEGEPRIDSGFEEGDEVSSSYDPLIAKLVVRGDDRAEAVGKLKQALAGSSVLGLRTNLGLLRDISRHPDYLEGGLSTAWLAGLLEGRPPPSETPIEVVLIAAAAEADKLASAVSQDPWTRPGWRFGRSDAVDIMAVIDDREHTLAVELGDPLRVDGREVSKGEREGEWIIADRKAIAARGVLAWFLQWEGDTYEIGLGPAARSGAAAAAGELEAPLPGQVIDVKVADGERVKAGQALVIVEAMKMEHTIRAPVDGIVAAVMCTAGQQVDRGQSLVDFQPD